MSIWVVGRKQPGNLRIFGQAIGLGIALSLLVLHDTALVIEFALGNAAHEMPHPVRLHEQRAI